MTADSDPVSPPDGLKPHQAAAWSILARGGSQLDAAKGAAEAIGRDRPFSAGTVQKWVRKWRDQHGDDLFRDAREEQARRGSELARTAADKAQAEAAQAWADLRTGEARNLGVTASQVRARLLQLVPSVGAEWVDRGPDGDAAPVVVRGPDARQIKDLATAIKTMLETAELLDDRPTRHTRRSVPSDQWQPRSDVGEPDPDERRQVVTDLVARLRERRTEGG